MKKFIIIWICLTIVIIILGISLQDALFWKKFYKQEFEITFNDYLKLQAKHPEPGGLYYDRIRPNPPNTIMGYYEVKNVYNRLRVDEYGQAICSPTEGRK